MMSVEDMGEKLTMCYIVVKYSEACEKYSLYLQRRICRQLCARIYVETESPQVFRYTAI